MHPEECKAIGVLDQLLGTPKSVLSSEAVLPKVNAAIRHLQKSSRKEGRAVDDLIGKLKQTTHQIKSYFRSDFGTVVELGDPSKDDPLLSIITAIHPSSQEFAAYGYAAEVLYEEADVWMKNTGKKLMHYAKCYSTRKKTTVEALRSSIYFGRKFAYVEKQAPGLGQIACQAKGLFNRVSYDDLATFWTAFQKESALVGLLSAVDFTKARARFRTRLEEKRCLFRRQATGDKSLSSQGQDLGTSSRHSINDSATSVASSNSRRETREYHVGLQPNHGDAPKQQPLSLLDSHASNFHGANPSGLPSSGQPEAICFHLPQEYRQPTNPNRRWSLKRARISQSSPSTISSSDVPSVAETSRGKDIHFHDSSEVTNGVQESVSDPPRMSHPPSLPQNLSVSENLLRHTRDYFQDSCRRMNLDDHGNLLNPNGTLFHNDLCNDFDSYCFTTTMLGEKGLRAEFAYALSKASALVNQILRAEHPRTLACFFEVFIHLIQAGHPGASSLLRKHIKGMSAIVTKNGTLWAQICRLLGELDSPALDQAMAQIWKCTADTFGSVLGTASRLAVSVRLDYIKRVFGTTNYLEEERLLRDLLPQLGGTPGPAYPRVMLNLAHNLNRQGRYSDAEEIALNVLSQLQSNEMYAKRIVERIESQKIIAHSQFRQGKAPAAEQTMGIAIQMIIGKWGIHHSWVLEFMTVLEGWLRGWGREEDANILGREIEVLMRKDEIEQLDGFMARLVETTSEV